ncbi:MAG: putative DNA binding domain-containing protein [Candidatus Aminicenantes bacterium]|nr:putative DNA binding domain-containing protein [Candidatus Aminicenantes bacterium]
MSFKKNEQLELKKSTSLLKEAVISIAAILNKHRKGELYFGIKNDGVVVGQTVTEKTIRDVSKAISDFIEPQIFPTIECVTIKNKQCIHVSFEGGEIPYYAYGRAYTRVGDENKKLSAKELENIIIKKNRGLLRWDNRISDTALENIDKQALKDFMKRAKQAGRVGFDFEDIETTLNKLGLLKNGKLLHAGNVLFCEKNSLEVQLAVFAGVDKITFLDIKQYKGSIFDLLERMETYIKEHIDWRVKFGQLRREEIPEIPIEAVREALVNSLCHRDYLKPESNKIAIFRNRVEIYNPGSFPEGFTPEDFISGKEQSILRNPLLAEILFKSKEIEKWGSGLKRIYEQCVGYGVKIEFNILKSGFMTTFYRREKEGSTWESRKKIKARDSEQAGVEAKERIDAKTDTKTGRKTDMKTSTKTNMKTSTKTNMKANMKTSMKTGTKIIELIKKNPRLSISELARSTGLSRQGAAWNIDKLKKKGMLERIGPARGGHWQVIESAPTSS